MPCFFSASARTKLPHNSDLSPSVLRIKTGIYLVIQAFNTTREVLSSIQSLGLAAVPNSDLRSSRISEIPDSLLPACGTEKCAQLHSPQMDHPQFKLIPVWSSFAFAFAYAYHSYPLSFSTSGVNPGLNNSAQLLHALLACPARSSRRPNR